MVLSSNQIWPAYVLKGKGKSKLSEIPTSSSEPSEPIFYIGDDVVDREAMDTSLDEMIAFAADICWIKHMRARSLLLFEERGYEKTSEEDWDLWDRACDEVFALARLSSNSE